MARQRGIASALRERGNDYSDVLKRQPSSRVPTLAIVIPTVKSEKFLSQVIDGLRVQTDRDFSLVIVQDGPSEFDLSPKSPFIAGAAADVIVARHQRNYGGASALNTGSLLAGTDTILMLDDDMVLPQRAVGEFRRLLALGSDVCTIGFRGTFESGTSGSLPQATLEDDWRCDVVTDASFMNLAVNPSGDMPRQHYRLLDETRGFRDFGYGRVIGYWDLPVMVGGHSVAVDCSLYVSAGGTPEFCIGWGIRDTALGAALITLGAYIVPQTEAVGSQIAHPPLAGTRQAQLAESKANLARHRRWLMEAHPAPIPRRRFSVVDGRVEVEIDC
jgi:hypothetical protein